MSKKEANSHLKTHQKTYGKNTIEALNAGFVWGYEGLINNIIDKIIKRFRVIITFNI